MPTVNGIITKYESRDASPLLKTVSLATAMSRHIFFLNLFLNSFFEQCYLQYMFSTEKKYRLHIYIKKNIKCEISAVTAVNAVLVFTGFCHIA